MVEALREELRKFNYVVQRNWEGLPELDKEHPDLDLLVSDEDYNDCLLVTQEYPWVDLRCPSDGYYPRYIADQMLVDRRDHEGWAIPNNKAHFLSLYYHNAVHKNGNPYGDKLRDIFLTWLPATKPDDPHVQFLP